MSLSLKDQKVVVIGGSSGMGLATARAAVNAGANVVIASRSAQKLDAAKADIGKNVEAQPLDLTQEDSIREFFQKIGSIAHLVIPGSSVKTGSLRELSLADAMSSMNSKFWGPYLAAKHAQLNPNGSIIFFSGILSRKPSPGMAVVAAINAAIEALGRTLALELAPVRVNVISPGLVMTSAYEGMPDAQREAMFQRTAQQLPVKRVGMPEDIADIALQLMTNRYITGTVIDIDGGGLLT